MKIISKNFRRKLFSRIDSAFTASRAEAIKFLIECYLADKTLTESHPDAESWAIFMFIRTEIDSAVIRSEKAREAASKRRRRQQSVNPVENAVLLESTDPDLLLNLPPEQFDQLPRPVRRRLLRHKEKAPDPLGESRTLCHY